MKQRTTYRGLIQFSDDQTCEALIQEHSAALGSHLVELLRKEMVAPDILLLWDSDLEESAEYEAMCSFLEAAMLKSHNGFAMAKTGADEFRWFDFPADTVTYIHPEPGNAPAEIQDLLPLDETLEYTFTWDNNGVVHSFRMAYEKFEVKGEAVYAVRFEDGKFLPPFFVHWANNHFVKRGRRGYLEILGGQAAPTFETVENAEYFLDLSGEDARPLAYVNEDERFFQLHSPIQWMEDGSRKIRVDFYMVGDGDEPVVERVYWTFRPGTGLAVIEAGDQEARLLKVEKSKKKRLFSLW